MAGLQIAGVWGKGRVEGWLFERGWEITQYHWDRETGEGTFLGRREVTGNMLRWRGV